ncbi:MAG: hypothetical protein OCD76_17580 [Reichenbachiella sp.]
MLKSKKYWNVVLVVVMAGAMWSCGDDDDDQAQIGLWLALENGVSRTNCTLESSNGSVSCPRFSSTSSCIRLDLTDNSSAYSLSVNVDGGNNRDEFGTYQIEEGKIVLCPSGGDCYNVPVVDAGLNDLTIVMNDEVTGCQTTIKMEKT